MDMNFRRYPIGVQNFEQLRSGNYVYVDKTVLVYKLANTNTTYFLSRPRRFGKSLLVSTLEAYFQGKKELFNGLAMETLEKEWTVYPVLHIDFSISKYTVADSLRAYLHYQLSGKKSMENLTMKEHSAFASPALSVVPMSRPESGW